MPEKETRAKSRRERIETARSRDILDVASELNMELVQSGRDYRWKEHDSLVISPDKNLWKWFSRNLGGDVISLVETIKETDFNQSVNFLNDGEFKTFQKVERSEEPFNYYLQPYEQAFIEARNYLREERGLSDDTIDFFLEKGVLAQANAKLNDSIEPVVVFKTLSPSGEVVGANLQGIEENFEKWPERGYAKIIARNSDGMNGLHVDIGQPKRLVFAESPIDLMSYYELHKDNLQDVRLVSMDGLKEATIGRLLAELQAERSGRDLRWSKEELANGLMTAVDNNYFTDGKHADVITLAVDNDEAGRNFITSLQEKGVSLTVDIPNLPEDQEKADWNSYLQVNHMGQDSTPKTEVIAAETLSLSDIQDHLSTEADLVSTIASDSSIIYTNTVSFNQDYSLNLEIYSPNEVDNLSDVKAPWTLEVVRDNRSLGYLAYGEDWGNDFNIEDELVNLDNWVTRNQVENHLYSQEEVNSFLDPLTAENSFVEQKSLEPFSDAQKEHIREFFKTRVSDIKTDYIFLPNGQEDLGYYLDGYLFAHHYAELDMLSPSKQVDALMERVSEHDQKFLEEHFGYQPDTPIEEYRQSEKNSDRIAEKEEQDFRNQFDRQSFAETIGLMQKYSPEEVLNESNSYHDDVRYQSLLIDLGKVDTNSLYRFIERYINRDIDREVLSQFSTQDFITIAKEHDLLNGTSSVEPWKAITVTQPVNRYTVLTDKVSEEFDNVSDLYQFVNQKLEHSQRQELSALLSEPGRGTPLDTLMAIDSVAGDVEVNGQSILSLVPDGINEEATEIYLRSSAELEAATSKESLPAEKEAVGELKSYGTFIIDDDFLERRYGSVEHDNSIRTAIGQLSNLIGFDDMPTNDQKTEWVHTKKVDFEGTQLILDVYSSSEDKIFEGKNQKNNWSIAVLGENGPLGFLSYGEAWLDDINEDFLRPKLTDLQTWIAEGSIGKHLYTQQDYNQFNASLKEKAPENLQETVTSNSEQQKNERTNGSQGSLQPLAEGSPTPVPETGTFERSVTSRPTISSHLLYFSINEEFKSINDGRYHSITQNDLAKLNRKIRRQTIQNAAQYYLEELANSKFYYVTPEKTVQVSFEEEHFMHLTGIKPTGEGQNAVKTLHDFAEGNGHFDNILLANNNAAFDKINVLSDLSVATESSSFYFDDLTDIRRYNGKFDSLIKSDDKDIILLFKELGEENHIPVSVFQSRVKIARELETINKTPILGVYRERDGHLEQLSVNEEYVKDNGEEMFSILQNKEYQELSNEQVEMPEPGQTELTAEDFTKVLDAVYNNGAQIGKDNRDNIPEALHPAWNKYDEYAAQHDNDFNQIMAAAEKDHLLDKNSDFYKAWSQDDIYDNHYHVRLQDLSDENSLPFQATDFIDYQDFARELYHQNQRSQSGDEVTNTTVNFAIYAPGGDLVKEGVSYHIGEESKPISQLLGLGYRRLVGYQDLAQMDNNALSQLENQTLNQTIAEDIAEVVPTSRETRQEVTASHNEAKTITSERQVLKNRFQRRVEEILNESPVQNQGNHRTGDIIINSTVAKNNSVIINSGTISNRQTSNTTVHKTPSSPKKSSEPVDYQKVSAYELSQAAFQKIREYTQSPKDLAEYLDFMSKFPTLSPRNVALIQAQWPGANAVATYNQWQAMGESLGLSKDDVMQTQATYTNKRTGQTKEVVHNSLSVKAGETSRITLFRPQMEKMIPVLDSNGNQLKNEKGNPKFKRLSQATPQEKALVKEKKLKVTLFQKRDSNGQPLYTTYKVFELSQTTLKPESYPKAMPNRHYNFDTDQVKTNEVLEGLCDYAKSIGVSILSDDAHTLGNIKGAFDPNRQEILLNPHNTPGEKIGTTIHELAHATLHNSKLQSSPQPIPRYMAELEAEMTSYLVSNHFGLDTGDKAFRYMAKWTDNLSIFSDKALTDSMTRIHKTVMSMVKQVEQHTKPYQRAKGQDPNFPKVPDKGLKR